MIREITKGENATTHHPLTDAQPDPSSDLAFRVTPPSLYTGHDVLWYGIPLWLVWVGCPVSASSLACPPPWQSVRLRKSLVRVNIT